MPSKKMELLNVWLPVIGAGVLIAIAVAAWFAERRIAGIWFGFAGVVCLLLLLALQLQEHERSREELGRKIDSPDRPWVSLEVAIAGPLAYDALGWDAGVRWHIPIKFKVTNTGNTPATNVDLHADIRPFMIGYWPADQIKDGIPQGQPIPGTDVPSELKKLCDGLAQMNKTMGSFMSKTLFKGQTWEDFFHLNGNPALFDAAREAPGYSGNILLLVCVSYKSTTDDRLHQTGESFAIFKPNAKIVLEDGTVPQADLRLTDQPMGGNFAN